MTIRFWYMREAFRYGTHSRRTMLYPRWDIERLGEALDTVRAISGGRDTAAATEATRLRAFLTRLTAIHDAFAELVPTYGVASESDEYQQELAELRRSNT